MNGKALAALCLLAPPEPVPGAAEGGQGEREKDVTQLEARRRALAAVVALALRQRRVGSHADPHDHLKDVGEVVAVQDCLHRCQGAHLPAVLSQPISLQQRNQRQTKEVNEGGEGEGEAPE